MEQPTKETTLRYWRAGAQRALKLAGDLAQRGYFDYALFFGHLAVEKLLKAIVVEILDTAAPRTHDLLYLAGLARIEMDKKREEQIAIITTFNIEGRYSEEKLAFHTKVTKAYAAEWLKVIKDTYVWLSKQKGK